MLLTFEQFLKRRAAILGLPKPNKGFYHAGTGSWVFPEEVINAPVGSSTVVAVNDALYYNTSAAEPFNLSGDQGSLLSNQQLMHDVFLGYALEAHAAGSASAILVATRGFAVMPFAAATTIHIGDIIGPDENDAGDKVENKRIKKVTNANAGLGRSVMETTGTLAYFYFISSYTEGGIQTIL